MKQEYTPEPNVEGDVISNDGSSALLFHECEDGSAQLLRYQWKRDKRYEGNIGVWTCRGIIFLSLQERKDLFEYVKRG